jgi:ATP-dependent Clp protease ATP-binding subunit ClpB
VFATMTSNLDFTDKASQSLNDSIQLAKDYANAQGVSLSILLFISNEITLYLVQPVHVAFTLLNEDAGTDLPVPGAQPTNAGTTLFASVISRVGGDPVRNHFPCYCLLTLIHLSSCP